MVEASYLLTCDGCGLISDEWGDQTTLRAFLAHHRKEGWRRCTPSKHPLDYCPWCVQHGHAKARRTDMNAPNPQTFI